MAKRCADVGVTVCGNGNADTRSTNGNTVTGLAICDGLADCMTEVWIIHGISIVCAQIKHIKAQPIEVSFQQLFHFIAAMISCNGNDFARHRSKISRLAP